LGAAANLFLIKVEMSRVLLSKYTDAIDLNSLLYLLEQSRHHRIFLFILVSCVNHLAHNHFILKRFLAL
jgi:hypothetical protein